MKKRYEHFPALAEMLRQMSPEGRELIRVWHNLLSAGFQGFAERTPRELGRSGFRPEEVEAARAALHSWAAVMDKVAGVIADPGPADWCCRRGMLAYPDPCPQHPGSKK